MKELTREQTAQHERRAPLQLAAKPEVEPGLSRPRDEGLPGTLIPFG